MKTKAILVLLILGLTGCGTTLPKVKIHGVTAQAPKDNGTPAKVETAGTVTTLPVPAGSVIETVPAIPATPTTDAVPATVKVTLAAPSELRQESHQESASSGTIDTTAVVKRIEVESAVKERKPLLWVAIGCGVAGMLALMLFKEWPAVGKGLLGAAVMAGVAWKVAEVPWWAFSAVLVGVGLVVLGYKRSDLDKDGNGVLDILESKKGQSRE